MERKNRPWITGESLTSPDFPNLTTVNGDGTKSFVEVTSRNYPTEDNPRYGGVRQDLWVEAGRGQELDWRLFAIASLGAMQFAAEHPERAVHLIRYWYRDPSVIV